MPKLTRPQQIERYGMTIAAAHKLRDHLAATLTGAEIKAAQEAWQALAYELRGGKGQPMQSAQHPEAIRFHMLRALADGKPLAEALSAAREFARG